MDPSTAAVVAGRGARAPGEPLSVPVALASTYRAGGDGPHYGRDGNPTWTALEDAIGALEGGSALAFSSGMAAAAAVFDGLPAGAVVIAPARGYHGVRRLLADAASRGHLRVRLADVSAGPETITMCRGADLLWIESPTNPLLDLADIALLADGARAAGARVAVDNTLATPLLQRPLDLGADVVVHSASKLLSGHSDLVMGAAVTRDPQMAASLAARRSVGGAVPGPLEAFLALRGLRTLPLRLERAQASAGELAGRLSAHPAVAAVRYPGLPGAPGHELAARQMQGFGTMLAFEVHDGAEAADAVCDAVRLIVPATSLGGVETMIERRARWPGEELTPPGLLRLSVGLEHVEDLWQDLEAALAAVRPAARTRRSEP
jgi:cystathionine gamma-synthase